MSNTYLTVCNELHWHDNNHKLNRSYVVIIGDKSNFLYICELTHGCVTCIELFFLLLIYF